MVHWDRGVTAKELAILITDAYTEAMQRAMEAI